MSIIQDRIMDLEKSRTEVENHPMCARLTEDAGYFYVNYPAGDFPVDGLRTTKKPNMKSALDRLIPVMERHWMGSYP